jgi:putative PIN family toxin of toxin-antitoxin system
LPLLEELVEVLQRPRVTKLRGLSDEEVREFVLGIAQVSTLIQITGTLALCRDPDDDIVLETAIIGQATHVVSRDEDLTRDPELQQHLRPRGIQVATVSQFLKELAGG